LIGSGDGGFWGLIVPGRVFFGLSEDFSFVSCVSSCLVFALLSIYFSVPKIRLCRTVSSLGLLVAVLLFHGFFSLFCFHFYLSTNTFLNCVCTVIQLSYI